MICFHKKYHALSFYFNEANAVFLCEKLASADDAFLFEGCVKESGKDDIYKVKVNFHCDDDYVFSNKRELIFWLSDDSLKYAIYKLTDFLLKKDFFPSEFCDFIISDAIMNPKGNRVERVPVYFLKMQNGS